MYIYIYIYIIYIHHWSIIVKFVFSFTSFFENGVKTYRFITISNNDFHNISNMFVVIKLHFVSPAMFLRETPLASPAAPAGPNPATKAKKHAYELLAQRLEAQSVQSDKVPQGRHNGITGRPVKGQ